jgi:hypothetical protein
LTAVALVCLRQPLKQLAGNCSAHAIEGGTVGELLRELEREHPAVAGGSWTSGARCAATSTCSATASAADRTRKSTPRTGSTSCRRSQEDERMTELMIGTKKGLFVLEGEAGSPFEVTARAFAGEPVEYALRDPRSGRVLASVTSPFYGPKVFHTDDPAGEWEQAEGIVLPEGGEAALERIWVLVAGEEDGRIYAGGDPGVLREPRRGRHVRAQPRAVGAPDAAEVAGGRRRAVPALDRDLARRAGPARRGDLRRRRLADRRRWRDVASRESRARPALPAGRHAGRRDRPLRAPLAPRAARPERLFMQFHGGVYRSDDAGESWTDIAEGLPSDFGFPLAVDPADPDSAFLLPLTADMDRVTPDGRVRVYETRDAGASWAPRGDGLPDGHAYLTVLREAFDRTGAGDSLELYFGATSGAVFGSGDAGASWFEAAEHLPPVYSVAVA